MAAPHSMVINDNESDAVIIDHDDISNYNPEQILPEAPEVLQKLRAWLQPTPYDARGSEYQKHQTSHVQGTGTWLTSSETYQKWLQSADDGLLWIKGIPGSGKSVMAATLIHALSTSHPGTPVLFFFFRQIIDANHKPQALLRDWMDQVLAYSPPLQKELKSYMDSGRSIESMSMESLWKDLRMAFSYLPGKVFCIADALDEMDDGNEVFLRDLALLGRQRPGKVKILITSRPIPSVEIPLRNIPSLQLRLEENVVDADISTFVQATLRSSNIPSSKWEAIINAVPGRANGLFLYAKLAMDAFLEPDADIQEILPKLPTDLNVLYTDLLEQHAQRSRVPPSVQHLILQAVTHATRPLRLLELAEMIRFGNPDNSSRDLKATKQLIRVACGPLLEILPDETISVIHHSFTEYLKGTTRSSTSPGYPILHPGPTHAQLALECLRYLESRDWSKYSIICVGGVLPPETTSLFGGPPAVSGGVSQKEAQLRLQHPFFHYAARNWPHHVCKSQSAGHDQREVNDQLRKFLGQEVFKQSRVHTAARFGLVSYARDLLSEDVNPNVPDQDGYTPVWLAASRGHAEMIHELVAAGANPDQENGSSGLKPLHEAATHNHYLAVQALLEAGVDPLTPKTKEDSMFSCGSRTSSIGHTPLMYACQNGHVQTVEVFLPFLKDMGTVHQALMWAAEVGKAEVVTRILQHPGVNPNARVLGGTPLFRACAFQDLPTIRALLNAGADPKPGFEPNKSGLFSWSDSSGSSDANHSDTCLHRLCGLGHPTPRPRKNVDNDLCQMIQILIEAGVDIHKRNPKGCTALHGAVRSAAMTRALIDAGADVNAVDLLGNTPLHFVKSPEVLEILVDHGRAPIDTPNSKGQTPLHYMLLFNCHSPSSIATITKFIEYGPDCNYTNSEGNRPLQIALGTTYPKLEIIQALLRGGADPNMANSHGLTPLLSTRLGLGSLEVAIALLERGADINAVDNERETFLYRILSVSNSSQKDEHRCIKSLIERGADVTVRDLAGRTALHQTVKSHAFTKEDTSSTYGSLRLDFLVSLGLDLQDVDHAGNSLLHVLAERVRVTETQDSSRLTMDCWRKLVAGGLDVDQKNRASRTALHILCAMNASSQTTDIGKPTPIDFVISQTRMIDSVDEDGVTPLHLAATGGVPNTKKLLDAGADPILATHEGLTALHLACRAKRSNIVGLLLSSLQSKSRQGSVNSPLPGSSPLSTPGVDAKAFGASDYITPLFYACRSGRPETVAILLDAGADINEGALRGCAEFEDENPLWQRKNSVPPGPSLFTIGSSSSPFGAGSLFGPGSSGSLFGTATNQAQHVNPVKLADNTRPVENFWAGSSMATTTVTARLEEILDMLLSKQPAILSPLLRGFIDKAVRDQRHYTARCFSDALKRYSDPLKEEYIVEPTKASLQSDNSEISTSQTNSLDNVKPGESNQELFRSLIFCKEYHLVEALARKGADFLIIPERVSDCNFSLLINDGFSSLVEVVGGIEMESRLADGHWHAFGDKTRAGLWSARSAAQNVDDSKREGAAFLVQAVARGAPNMAVVRVLVEKLHVDINEREYVRKRMNHVSKLLPTNSALHHVAEGRSWWRTYQALPYLLKAGADTEVRNHKGQTPLLLVLEEISIRPGLFQRDVIRTLLEWGADVNAVDDTGNSCLSHAKHDIDLFKLLMKKGATPSFEAVFSTIEETKPDALKVFLEAGFDPNTHREDQPSRSASAVIGARVETRGNVLLYNAGLKLQGYLKSSNSQKLEEATKIVQMLLSYGANPFARFFTKRPTQNVENKLITHQKEGKSLSGLEGYEEHMVFHELMRCGEPLHVLLDIDGLDVNYRDAQGRTLLHMACKNHPDRIYTSPQETSDKTTLFKKLLSLGATLEARDESGRNVLHHMIDHFIYTERCTLTLVQILDEAPNLALQSDIMGNTPLHHAVRFASFRRHTEIAEALLSAGADVLAVTNNEDNVLHLLAKGMDTPELRNLFQNLARRGANINACNLQGETPLFAFSRRARQAAGGLFSSGSGGLFGLPRIEYSETGALQLLESLGADFSVRDRKGQGPLHIAATGDVGRFKELLSVGLDPMLEDDMHQTAIDVAAACGNREVLSLFEKKN